MPTSAKILIPFFALYLLDFLLLTPVGVETRPQSDVTGFGYVVVILFFVGVVLAVLSLTFVFRRPGRVPIFAMASALLSVPAVLADQAGLIHASNPPTYAIDAVELIQILVVLAVVILALQIRRPSSGNPIK